MKASDLFIRCLENEGVEYIFGIPGEENLDFLESLRRSKIKLIVTRHEQAAVFMAATYGRLTGKAGVALSTLGPGATNLITGVAYAQLGAMPLVVITGQKPIKENHQGQFQIVDIVALMKPITKMSAQINSSEKIPAFVQAAFRQAEEERPGATHLELPEDIAREKTRSLPLASLSLAARQRPAPHPGAIAEAIKMIEAAKHPLILVAASANRKHICEQLNRFIQKTKIPFFTTQMGKGVVDGRSDCCLGTAAFSENDYLHCAFEKTDLIISIGHDITEKPPMILKRGKTKIIHFNFYPAQVDEIYAPALEVVGDMARALSALTAKIKPSAKWDFSFFQKIRATVRKKIQQKDDSARFPIIPQRLVRDLRRVVPEDGIIALDNGVYKIWIARNYPAYQQNTVLLDNALATMGAGLPSAMAAKIVFPNRKVAAICGDGGFMMNSQELETAVRLKLDLVVLILNDNAFGMIKWKQKAMGFKDFGLDLGNPDFVKYARSYGAHGYRVKKADDFAPLLKKCFNSKGVQVIEVPMDYSENAKVLTKELERDKC